MSEIRVNKVVNSTGDNDSGLDMTTNDQVLIKTANTTAITVDSSQNVTLAGNLTVSGTATGVGGGINKNYIINGGMIINQRNGTTLTSSTNNNYNFDRWKLYLNGSVAVSTQQLSALNANVVSLNTASSENFNNVMSIDCTTNANLGSSDMLGQVQIIEGSESVPLAGKSCTLSFWVKSNITGQYYVTFKIGSARSYVAPYTISSANTWQKKTITLTMDTLANLNTSGSLTNGAGFHVYFGLRLGTSSQQTSTINQWVSGNFYGTSSQVTWGTNSSDSFYMSGVKLELGASATAFNHNSIGEELQICRRYFYKTNPDNQKLFGEITGNLYSANQAVLDMNLSPIMRSSPAVTRGGTYNTFWVAGKDTDATTGTAITGAKRNSLWWETASMSIANGGVVGFQVTYNGQLSIDAEL